MGNIKSMLESGHQPRPIFYDFESGTDGSIVIENDMLGEDWEDCKKYLDGGSKIMGVRLSCKKYVSQKPWTTITLHHELHIEMDIPDINFLSDLECPWEAFMNDWAHLNSISVAKYFPTIARQSSSIGIPVSINCLYNRIIITFKKYDSEYPVATIVLNNKCLYHDTSKPEYWHSFEKMRK